MYVGVTEVVVEVGVGVTVAEHVGSVCVPDGAAVTVIPHGPPTVFTVVTSTEDVGYRHTVTGRGGGQTGGGYAVCHVVVVCVAGHLVYGTVDGTIHAKASVSVRVYVVTRSEHVTVETGSPVQGLGLGTTIEVDVIVAAGGHGVIQVAVGGGIMGEGPVVVTVVLEVQYGGEKGHPAQGVYADACPDNALCW